MQQQLSEQPEPHSLRPMVETAVGIFLAILLSLVPLIVLL